MLLRKIKPIQLWKYGLPAEKHTSQNNMFQAVPFIKNNKNRDFLLCKLSYFSCFLFGALYLCPIKKYIDREKGLYRQYIVYPLPQVLVTAQQLNFFPHQVSPVALGLCRGAFT
jgi:hypothetical protein